MRSWRCYFWNAEWFPFRCIFLCINNLSHIEVALILCPIYFWSPTKKSISQSTAWWWNSFKPIIIHVLINRHVHMVVCLYHFFILNVFIQFLVRPQSLIIFYMNLRGIVLFNFDFLLLAISIIANRIIIVSLQSKRSWIKNVCAKVFAISNCTSSSS